MYAKKSAGAKWFEPVTIFQDDPRVVTVKKLQRPLKLRKVKKFVAEWDDDAVGTLEMDAMPDGTIHPTDGQHRFEAAKIVAAKQGRRIPFLVKLWHERPEHEIARGFISINVDRGPVAANDLWFVRRETYDPTVLDIDRVLAEFGCEVVQSGHRSKRWNLVTATRVLERIYEVGGEDLLRRTLKVAFASFQGDRYAVEANFLAGIAWVLYAFEDDPEYAQWFDRTRLISRLRETSADAIKRETSKQVAQAGYNRTEACAHALVVFYNWKLRYRLEDHHLNERVLTWQ